MSERKAYPSDVGKLGEELTDFRDKSEHFW